MRRIGKVEHLDLLGDGHADGHRQVSLGIAELVIIEQGLQRHHRRIIVRHLKSHGIRQHHDSDSPAGVQCHCKFLGEVGDGGDFHARRRIDLVQGHGRAYHGHDILHSDFVCLQG